MQQAVDFESESSALAELLHPLDERVFDLRTQFKQWTVGDVVGHLHMFNRAAELALDTGDGFSEFMARFNAQAATGKSMLAIQHEWLDGLAGRELYDVWRRGSQELAERFQRTDPDRRLPWAGPPMSARSCITARQMETWAHGHGVFDILGRERPETDRIKNIAHLGAITFGWAFQNRGEGLPSPPPHLRLRGPSGAWWLWNEHQADSFVEGEAVDFCRVVTQVRGVADTGLRVEGPVASRWMAIAQCFAGRPETPPLPGTRYREGLQP